MLAHAVRLPPLPGVQPDSAALAAVLTRNGITTVHGLPVSEPLLFGLAGGIGATVSNVVGLDGPTFHLGLRHAAANIGGVFVLGACARAGLDVEVHRTVSSEEGENRLVDVVGAGEAVGVWVDPAGLPWRRLPWAAHGAFARFVGVTAFDEDDDEFAIEDGTRSAVPLDAGRLRTARRSNPAIEHRMLRIRGVTPADDPRPALEAGLRAGVHAMLNPPLRNMGVQALRTWTQSLRDTQSSRGWHRRYTSGTVLYRALAQIFHAIETDGTGRGGLRPLFADYLDLCAMTASGRKAVAWRSAAQWSRTLGGLWSALAETALPAGLPGTGPTAALLRTREAAFRSDGIDGLAEIQEVFRALEEIEEDMDHAFPLSAREVDELLLEIATQVEGLAEQEEAFGRSLLLLSQR